MKVLVTGSAGHLGEALMRRLADAGHAALGLDRVPGRFTQAVGRLIDAALARQVGLKGYRQPNNASDPPPPIN